LEQAVSIIEDVTDQEFVEKTPTFFYHLLEERVLQQELK